MKKKEKKAEGHKVLDQPEMSTTEAIKVTEFKVKHKSQTEGGHEDLIPIKYVDTDGSVKIHSYRSYGNWSSSDFIYALENIQDGICDGSYRDIDDVLETLRDVRVVDQLILVDIAYWYLHDVRANDES